MNILVRHVVHEYEYVVGLIATRLNNQLRKYRGTHQQKYNMLTLLSLAYRIFLIYFLTKPFYSEMRKMLVFMMLV